MIKVGIIGGAGYTAGELLRILVNHPEARIVFVHSQSNAGNPVASVHEGLIGDTDLIFSDSYDLHAVDCLFMCSGHGASAEFWRKNERPADLRVIDLAQDFRDESEGYVYGLPEINRERIAATNLVANPGCFATAIQLALLPLAATGLLTDDVEVTGITGSTGAGVKPGATTHFSWRTDNLSVYKPFSHQHLAEIRRSLASLMPGFSSRINFIPVRGNFARGIYVMAHTRCPLDEDALRKQYEDFYAGARFTFVSDTPVDMKQAVNTNKAVISVEKHGDRALILCAVDNLLKGASGQAVQNMNLMFGLPEDAGLKLKPSGF